LRDLVSRNISNQQQQFLIRGLGNIELGRKDKTATVALSEFFREHKKQTKLLKQGLDQCEQNFSGSQWISCPNSAGYMPKSDVGM
jgi:hypothetical protein